MCVTRAARLIAHANTTGGGASRREQAADRERLHTKDRANSTWCVRPSLSGLPSEGGGQAMVPALACPQLVRQPAVWREEDADDEEKTPRLGSAFPRQNPEATRAGNSQAGRVRRMQGRQSISTRIPIDWKAGRIGRQSAM